MAEGRRKEQWAHTAEIVAEVRNAAFGRTKVWKAAECNPYRPKAGDNVIRVTPKEQIEILAKALCRGR